MEHTSSSLLGRLQQANDNDAWQRFADIYAPWIEGWLRRRGVPADVAEDVRQDVLTKVSAEISGFDHNGRMGAFRRWLRLVTQHRLRAITSRMSFRDEAARHDWSQTWDELAADNSELSQLWDKEHDAYVIRQLLELVSPEFKKPSLQAFRRVVLDGEEVDDVARDLGLSANAVRIAQSRVLNALRREGQGLLFQAARES